MPWLLIEPRPYSLIRAQIREPLFFFPTLHFSSLYLSTTCCSGTLHHHAKLCNHAVLPPRLASGHAALVSLYLSTTCTTVVATTLLRQPSRRLCWFVAPFFPAPPFCARPFIARPFRSPPSSFFGNCRTHVFYL